MRRTRRSLVWSLGLILALVFAAPGSAQVRGEYEVKAYFLRSFTDYVTWPSEGSTSATFRIGVLGDDPFGADLDRLAGLRAEGRDIEVLRFATPEELEYTPILFVSDPALLARIPDSLRGGPTLYVGDNDDFIEAGGTVRFFLRDRRIRFEIDRCAASRGGMRISAQLLRLADVVCSPERAP